MLPTPLSKSPHPHLASALPLAQNVNFPALAFEIPPASQILLECAVQWMGSKPGAMHLPAVRP